MVRIPVSPRLIGAVLAFFVRLWHLTLRVERLNTDVFTDPELRAKRPVIMLWHDEIFPLIPAHAGERMACVVSQSKDGEILARVLESFGFMSVRGSSSRGGMRAPDRRQAGHGRAGRGHHFHRGRAARTASQGQAGGRVPGPARRFTHRAGAGCHEPGKGLSSRLG